MLISSCIKKYARELISMCIFHILAFGGLLVSPIPFHDHFQPSEVNFDDSSSKKSGTAVLPVMLIFLYALPTPSLQLRNEYYLLCPIFAKVCSCKRKKKLKSLRKKICIFKYLTNIKDKIIKHGLTQDCRE